MRASDTHHEISSGTPNRGRINLLDPAQSDHACDGRATRNCLLTQSTAVANGGMYLRRAGFNYSTVLAATCGRRVRASIRTTLFPNMSNRLAADNGCYVGRRTIAHFHTRYLGLLARCEGELRGTSQLFPPASRTSSKRFAVPKGEANLRFGKGAVELLDEETEEPSPDDSVVRQVPVGDTGEADGDDRPA